MTNRRIPALDGVRGLAVILVTVSHAGFPLLKLGAIVGVTLFFVLSGYLITTLLLDERQSKGRVSFRGFYMRRARRLLPALLVMLVIYLPLALVGGQDAGQTLAGVGLTAVYVNNLHSVLGVPITGLGQCWSLSLEEQFYLLWPALLAVTFRLGRRWMLAVVIGLIAASFAIRSAYGWTTAQGYEHAYYLPQASVWAILFGVALALAAPYLQRFQPPTWLATAMLIGLVAVSSLLGMTRGIMHSGANYPERLLAGPLAAALSVALVWAVTRGEAPRWVVRPWLLFFGAISYALYLWHDTLIDLIGLVVPNSNSDARHFAIGTFAAVIAVGLATLSYEFVERPFLRHRRPAVEPTTQAPVPVG